ncbi:LysR substrate-binding domain-containing protein [Thetidibacter halocola]|uniref:LysR family transcriptional regulator n=1 Tax=Thetidibacter halocola TaxID=2827239 RepID=A0A8J8B590_9RHOB|nr:LysR substrate-binding domain-containing protein [Thetidibacter halocola]MBS0122686.1 LysR family transcriptional regulator [Thetidibacter halocola]
MKVNRKNDLSLRLLEIFGAVMLHQTTVDAAYELGISQPAVSLALKQLESQIGFSLFERRSQRLQPTEEARSLFAQIEPILLQLRSVESHVGDLRKGTAGKLRIMATPPLGHSVVPRALRRFLADRPRVTIQYDVRRMENVIQEVEIGSAELGIVLALDSHPAVEVRRLNFDAMVALVPAGHPLAGAEAVTPQDCLEHDHIGLDQASRLGMLLRNAFDAAGVPYLPRVVVRYCHTSAVLANAGMGIAIVDRHTADFMGDQGLVARPFLPRIEIGACLLIRRDVPLSRLAAGFVEAFEAALHEGDPR